MALRKSNRAKRAVDRGTTGDEQEGRRRKRACRSKGKSGREYMEEESIKGKSKQVKAKRSKKSPGWLMDGTPPPVDNCTLDLIEKLACVTVFRI